MEVDDSPDRRYTLEELLDEGEFTIPDPPAAIGVGKEGEPRLMIKQIVNENFKSYAGRKVIGPFHKAFTSIVGPNGSGKSNVIDSMLFVFGYRAQKIRSKKVSVLIHNSEKYPNLRQATVSVHFWMITDKEGDDFDVVPDSEFVVSRTAFKDNSSHYMIDGKKTNFKEVGRLLGEKGIDLVHNRFLILQGEVEQISQMKPKAENPNEEGMLEYLEDIIGSSRLKPFIEKLNNQVEQLNEHRTERNNRVKLAEDEKNTLATGYEDAKKWLELKNKHTRNENMILQSTIYNKEKSITATEAIQAELTEQINVVDSEIKAHTEANREIFKAAQKAKKRRAKIDSTVQNLKDKSGELESKNKILYQENKMKKDRSKKLEKELTAAKAKVTDYTEMPQKCIAEEEKLNEKLEELNIDEKRQHGQLEDAISFVEKETSQLRKKKEPLEKKLIQIQNGVNEKHQLVDAEKSELENYTAKYDRAVNGLKKINEDIEAAKTKVTEVEAEKITLDESIPEIEQQIPTMETELAKLQEDRSQIQEALGKTQTKLSEAKQDGGAVRSQNKVFDYIMNHLKKKRIVSGIIGRLGDLGGIHKRFDVALSSSCNMNLMVVETSKQAKDIVGMLKKDNVGSCTFFAMDKMGPFRPASGNLPGPRLVDEIQCDDPALMKVFYKACRDTLYAENINAARQMSRSNGRHRVVSLDGSVLETSGTFTGGGNRQMRGAMAEKPQIKVNEQTIPEEEIERMTNETEQYREQLRHSDHSIRKLQGEIAQLKRQLQKHKERFEIIGSEWNTANDKIKLLQARIKSAEKEVKNTEPDKKELNRLENALKDCEVDYGAAKAQAETAREEVDELNKQIGEIGKGKIEGTKKLIKKTKNEIVATKKKVIKTQNDAKTAERNRKKAEDNVATLTEEGKEIEERMEIIKKELDIMVGEFEELQTDQEELGEHLKEAIEHEKVSMVAVDKSEKDIEHLKTTIQGHKSKFAQNKDNITTYLHDVKAFKHKLKNLKIDPIELTDETALPTLEATECEEVDIPPLIQANLKFQTELDHHRPNLGAITEYRSRVTVYLERVKEYDVVNEARNTKRETRNQLLKRRHSEFTEGFDIITNKVKQMYQMITLGGDAELELVNSLAPFDDGVIFTVRPPKKSWKNIMNLSGGEKTLSSLALVFALHHYKPTPLYVMDEIDAALDIKNVSIVAHYIKDRTKNAQFIIISLRNQMFGLASRLCGIYKTDNCTKMVVIENQRDFEEEKENIDAPPSTTVFTRSPMKTARNLNTSVNSET